MEIERGYTTVVGDYIYRCVVDIDRNKGWNVTVSSDRRTQQKYGKIVSPYLGLHVVSLDECFSSCKNMIESPELPDTVVDLKGTFANCRNLKTPPVLPLSAKIMRETFFGCDSLSTPPVIPNGVLTLISCFRGAGITSLPKIPDSVYYLNRCFAACKNILSLEGFRFPNNGLSKELGITGCFSGCSSLTEIPEGFEIPDKVAVIDSLFSHCGKLKYAHNLVIPSSVTSMESCFSCCYILETTPTLPETILDAVGAFAYCQTLERLPILPKTVQKAKGVFAGCTAVKIFDKDFKIPPGDKPKGYFRQFPDVEAVPVGLRKPKYFD